MNITGNQTEYISHLEKRLMHENIRVEADLRNEKIGYKIREAQMEKIPFMLVAGDKEMQNNEISVRDRKQGDMGVMKIDQFIDIIKEKINSKALE
jgi:threonyl-tRNA synthetase